MPGHAKLQKSSSFFGFRSFWCAGLLLTTLAKADDDKDDDHDDDDDKNSVDHKERKRSNFKKTPVNTLTQRNLKPLPGKVTGDWQAHTELKRLKTFPLRLLS